MSSFINKCTAGTTQFDAVDDQSMAVTLEDVDMLISKEYSPKNRSLAAFFQGLTFKEAGNVVFGQGKFNEAILEYSKGIDCFKPPSKGRDLENEVGYDNQAAVDLLAALLGNRAACHLRLYNYAKALDDSNASIHFKPQWDKAYARRGEALVGLRFYQTALEAFQMAGQFPQIDFQIAKCKAFIQHESEQRIEVHQLLPGRDICINPSMIFAPINTTIWERVGIPLRNFIYLIVNKDTREAIIIDACWDIDGIMKYAEKHNIRIVAAFITHYQY